MLAVLPRVNTPPLAQRPAKRQALAETIGADGMALLRTLFASDAPTHLRLVPAVDVLRRL